MDFPGNLLNCWYVDVACSARVYKIEESRNTPKWGRNLVFESLNFYQKCHLGKIPRFPLENGVFFKLKRYSALTCAFEALFSCREGYFE